MRLLSHTWLFSLIVSTGLATGLSACDPAEDHAEASTSGSEEATSSGAAASAAAHAQTSGAGSSEPPGSGGPVDPSASDPQDGSSSGGAPEPPVDPCDAVRCAAEERCVQGACVGPGEDPPPPPGYEDPALGCPAGVTDGNGLEAPMRPMNLCLPTCDPTAADAFAACPQPTEGTAVAACLNGTAETSGTCDGYGSACEAESSWCTHPLLQTYVCSQATLCVLDCTGDRTCPSGMQCDAGTCAFAAG